MSFPSTVTLFGFVVLLETAFHRMRQQRTAYDTGPQLCVDIYPRICVSSGLANYKYVIRSDPGKEIGDVRDVSAAPPGRLPAQRSRRVARMLPKPPLQPRGTGVASASPH